MDSNGDSTLIDTEDFWEEGYLAIEAANRLRVFNLFEECLGFTDVFRDTIKKVNEGDSAWKEYIKLLDMPRERVDDGRWNDNMYKMAAALVCIHVLRLEMAYVEEDLWQTIELLRVYSVCFLRNWYLMTTFSEEELGKWTRERHKWLPLEIAQLPHINLRARAPS